MKAMALAAGKGTRLYPLTGEIPKPMAPVADTPIIEHIFFLLATHGVREVYVNVHYMADALLETYGEESTMNGMSVHLSREEELLGTAGGVKRLAANFDDTFVVISGDALTDVDVGELVTFHKEKGALATIALHRVSDTAEFGVVDIDEECTILGFQEKPDPKEAISTLANTGIYVFEPRALDSVPEGTFFDFARYQARSGGSPYGWARTPRSTLLPPSMVTCSSGATRWSGATSRSQGTSRWGATAGSGRALPSNGASCCPARASATAPTSRTASLAMLCTSSAATTCVPARRSGVEPCSGRLRSGEGLAKESRPLLAGPRLGGLL